jgi:hypothetical protein
LVICHGQVYVAENSKFPLEVCWQFLAKQSTCKERELALLHVLKLMPHNAKCTDPLLFWVLEMTMLGSIKTFSSAEDSGFLLLALCSGVNDSS